MKKLRFTAYFGVKKVVSLSIACLMALSLGGCGGNTAISGQSKITTESFSTMTEEKLTVPDHTQKIDDGAVLPDATTEAETTEETTEAETPAVNNGSYSYTIYDGIEVTLPFNIDDYLITNSDGIQVAMIKKLATDYGWIPEDDERLSGTYYHYDCGDYYAYFQLESPYEEECGFPGSTDDFKVYQIRSCELKFSPENEPDKYYFEAGPAHTEKSNIELKYNMHYSDCQYVYAGSHPNTALSKDDSIMIAYLLTFVSNNPDKGNPMYCLDSSKTHPGEENGWWTSYDLP